MKEKNRDPFSGFEDRANEVAHEKEMKRKNQDFDAKLEKLANKTVDILMESNEDNDFLAEMMTSFLDVALEMKRVIKTLDSINIATGCIYEAISFVDVAINYNDGLQKSSLQQDHGFFSRWKRKRQIRKAIRNNNNRMKSAIDSILGQFEMSQEIVESLRVMSERMHISMAKGKAKREKRAAKKGVTLTPTLKENGTSPAKELIAKIMKERGLTPPTTVTSGTDSNTSGAGTGAGDISDIL